MTSCTCCRLAFCDNGKPYIVPLNFGFEEKSGRYFLYFHGASEGRKIDLIRKTGWAAFEMDIGHELIQGPMACNHSARYQCVMGEGKISLLESTGKKIAGLTAIMAHATGKRDWEFDKAALDKTQVTCLEVKELTCKIRA